MEHRHELREILTEDVCRRDGVRRFVVLAPHEGRAVGDGEEREPEARDEKRRGDCCVPRVPRERCSSEPQCDRAATPHVAKRAQRRRHQPRGENRRREHDQRRYEEQVRARTTARGELLRIDRAARPADEHDGDRPKRGGIERRQPESSDLDCGGAHGREEQQPRSERHTEGAKNPAARQQRMRDDVAGGRPCPGRDERCDRPAEHPADECPECRKRGRLGQREQLDLPASGAEPRQSPPCVGRVAPQRRSGEDREREQERAALAPEQQEPASCGARRTGGRDQRFRRCRDLKTVGARFDLRGQPLHPRLEGSDLPGVHVTALDREEPGIRAIERLELRCLRKPGDAVRDHDW